MAQEFIVWREGMFIAPQHFQMLEDSTRSYVNNLMKLDVNGNDYGFSHLKIDSATLESGQFSISEAAGVFPDRTFFSLNSQLSLHVPEGTVDGIVYLALPLMGAGVQRVGQDRGTHREISRHKELLDTTDQDSEPLLAEVSEYGCCLLFNQQELSGHTLIPVAHILERTNEGKIILNKEFTPPFLSLQAVPNIQMRLDEILRYARSRAENAAARIKREKAQQSKISLFTEYRELEILNQLIFKLQSHLNFPHASARRIFNDVSESLSFLEALSATVVSSNLIFNTQKIGENFNPVFNRMLRLLSFEQDVAVEYFDFNLDLFDSRRLLRLILPSRIISSDKKPILEFSNIETTEDIYDLAPRACKLSGLSEIQSLVQHDLPGISLLPMQNAPISLRARSDAAFFEVSTTSPLWRGLIAKREALALHIDVKIPKPTVRLYFVDE